MRQPGDSPAKYLANMQRGVDGNPSWRNKARGNKCRISMTIHEDVQRDNLTELLRILQIVIIRNIMNS